jgi:hypothetical protein
MKIPASRAVTMNVIGLWLAMINDELIRNMTATGRNTIVAASPTP